MFWKEEENKNKSGLHRQQSQVKSHLDGLAKVDLKPVVHLGTSRTVVSPLVSVSHVLGVPLGCIGVVPAGGRAPRVLCQKGVWIA